MILYGQIRFGESPFGFVLPVFMDKNDLYIQDTTDSKKIINFVPLGKPTDLKDSVFDRVEYDTIEKNIGDDVFYIFWTHNKRIMGSREEIVEQLNSYYREISFHLFELMRFLKNDRTEQIKNILFPEFK